jgi:hypothetical protein
MILMWDFATEITFTFLECHLHLIAHYNNDKFPGINYGPSSVPGLLHQIYFLAVFCIPGTEELKEF